MPPTIELSEEQKALLSLEDQETTIVRMKTRVRGMCVSLGELVIRQMVGLSGFTWAASALLAESPEEHMIEGICEMLLTAGRKIRKSEGERQTTSIGLIHAYIDLCVCRPSGASLDDDPRGKSVVETCLGRLQELQAKGNWSKRLSCIVKVRERERKAAFVLMSICAVQNLLDARKVGWHVKLHKRKAKGLSALKEEVWGARESLFVTI